MQRIMDGLIDQRRQQVQDSWPNLLHSDDPAEERALRAKLFPHDEERDDD